jgi:hypothetical protein
MISQDQARRILQERYDRIKKLRPPAIDHADFKKWYCDTRIAIERIFGQESSHVTEFVSISYGQRLHPDSTTISSFKLSDVELYARGLASARTIIQSMIDELDTWGVPRDPVATAHAFMSASDPTLDIRKLCERFHKIAKHLRDRYGERPTLSVEDGYDVQDLFHSLLHLYFDDVRKEKTFPLQASENARFDLFLKNIGTFIKVDRIKRNLKERELTEQLIVDIDYYKSHPHCKKLVCFVYDPEGRISNPGDIESRLTGEHDSIAVTVVISPQ